MRRVTWSLILALLATLPSVQSQSAFAGTPSTGVGVTTSNLLAYYDFANPSGISGTAVTDLAGNYLNGTLIATNSMPAIATSQGRFLNFNGSGGYIDINDLTSSSNWSGLTITFYANFGSSADNFERIIDFGRGAQNENILIGREGVSGNLFIEIYNNGSSGGYCRSTANSLGSNAWHQWSITIGGGTCTIYKNNALNNQQAYSTLPLARTLTNNYIGKSNWPDAAFEGGISDVAIYDRVLNSTELTKNYNAQVDISAPSLSSTFLSSPENTRAVTTLSTGETSYFSLISGGDSPDISLYTDGRLEFSANPNYEAPADGNLDNQYGFNVRFMDANGNYAETYVQITVTNVSEIATLTAPTLSATPYKGVNVTISVSPSAGGTAGRVTYLIGGKRISGCYKKIYSGSGSATCSWRPATFGNREISVTFTPNGSEYSAATVKKALFIYKRATNR